uniref:HVA22-like protein n=1 Tax=Aegilops tauschii subsp. strangulata TaxID=200361 RepID=A0A453B9M8_AEGTS
MAALLAPAISGEVGLRLLLAPLSSNIVIRTASCAVGIGLPVYSTYRAIEKKDQDEKERLLLYWAAYGSFSIVESFADKLVSRVFLCITMRNLLSLYGSSFLQMVDQSMCTEDTCARFSRSIKQKLIES